MYIFKTIFDLKNYLEPFRSNGFVPTMGALHEGHIALLNQSKKENELSGVSIFVNPTQFNNKNDFDKYPITIEKDIEMLLEANCDYLFLPSVSEMYPNGLNEIKKYDLGKLNDTLEGEFRPGHFDGVCTIVEKLLHAVTPNKLYMGEKDFQQCMVVKRLLELSSLPVNLIIYPTLRDDDGLAKSSRNVRLSMEARMKANTIFTCLKYIQGNQKNTCFEELKKECLSILKKNGFETEYLVLAKSNSLQVISDFDFTEDMVVLIASKLDGVRLIDNMRM